MLDRAGLVELLEALAAELSTMGVRGEMFVVGGAAMALALQHPTIDARYRCGLRAESVVYQAAQQIAAERGLDPDWLNDAVEGFLPGPDAASTVLFEQPGLAVRIASPRYLLAIKVMAARVERDEDDIVTLAALSGKQSVAAILDLVQEAYPHPG